MNPFAHIRAYRRESITVSALCELAPIPITHHNHPVGEENQIVDPQPLRPQFPLAGFFDFFSASSLLLFGRTEFAFLRSLPDSEAQQAVDRLFSYHPPAVLITHDQPVSPLLEQQAAQYQVALLTTALETATAYALLTDFFAAYFAPYASVHGSFVDVYGIGILFIGRSGIGKSEIALDLVERGHRLVADDLVILSRPKKDIIIGRGTEISRHFMEIRGLGIVDVRQMFGVRAVRYQKRLEIVVQLEEWSADRDYERTGLTLSPISLFDTAVHHVVLPIYPGKNITVIAETIALNYVLKMYGYNAAQVFADRQKAAVAQQVQELTSDERRFLTPYFYNDTE